MKAFAKLIYLLEETDTPSEKVMQLIEYFRNTDAESAAWAVYLLSGNKIKKQVHLKEIRNWCVKDIPEWLFQESYQFVGDLTETVSLLSSAASYSLNMSLHEVITTCILPLKNQSETEKKTLISSVYAKLDAQTCLVFTRLLTGNFKSIVSQTLLGRALAQMTAVSESVIQFRLSNGFTPEPSAYMNVLSAENPESMLCVPYVWAQVAIPGPDFFENPLKNLHIERKWRGLRVQLIKRKGKVFIWSESGDLVTHQFPEITTAMFALENDCVLDGVFVAYKDHIALSESNLQKRLSRKNPDVHVLQEIPVICIVFDIPEYKNEDIRNLTLVQRKQILSGILENSSDRFRISPELKADSWAELDALRNQNSENSTSGLILKQNNSVYPADRQNVYWWKWNSDPKTVIAVLVYAQRMQGANTVYTFALWDQGELKTFARTDKGLTESETRELDMFIKAHTLEKFGPVRTISPELVFEIEFDEIYPSPRHKSGFRLKAPRILRWRKDLQAQDASQMRSVPG